MGFKGREAFQRGRLIIEGIDRKRGVIEWGGGYLRGGIFDLTRDRS